MERTTTAGAERELQAAAKNDATNQQAMPRPHIFQRHRTSSESKFRRSILLMKRAGSGRSANRDVVTPSNVRGARTLIVPSTCSTSGAVVEVTETSSCVEATVLDLVRKATDSVAHHHGSCTSLRDPPPPPDDDDAGDATVDHPDVMSRTAPRSPKNRRQHQQQGKKKKRLPSSKPPNNNNAKHSGAGGGIGGGGGAQVLLAPTHSLVHSTPGASNRKVERLNSIVCAVTTGLWNKDPRVVKLLFTKLADMCSMVNEHDAKRNQKDIFRLGGPLVIIKAMQRFPHDPALQAEGSRLLANLVNRNDDNQIIIGLLGGIEAILVAMNNFPDHLDLQCKGCAALRNLSCNRTTNARIFVESGDGIPRTIIRAMKKFPSNAFLQESGCAALWHLASIDMETKAVVIRSGGAEVIGKALADHYGNPSVQREAIDVLKKLATNY